MASDSANIVDNDEIVDDKPEVVLDADLGETASRCKTIGPDVNDYECDDLSEVEEDLDHSIVPIVEISGRILTHNIDNEK